MSFKSMFWPTNGIGHGPLGGYTEADWRGLLDAAFVGNAANEGIFPYWNKLGVAAGSGVVTVVEGAAIARGCFGRNDGPINITVPVSIGATTVHRLVLRITYATQTILPFLISAANGVTTLPAKAQTEGVIWDIDLATVYRDAAGTITVQDTRPFLHFNTLINGTQIDLGSIDGTRINGNIAGAGLTHTGTDLNVNVDTTTIQIASDVLSVKNDSIDDTKVGNRVPQLYRRQGGHATDWSVAGTTNYTPGAVRMQAGIAPISVANGASTGVVVVTFPVAFSAEPLVLCTPELVGYPPTGYAFTVTSEVLPPNVTTEVSIKVGLNTVNALGFAMAFFVKWLAIGAE